MRSLRPHRYGEGGIYRPHIDGSWTCAGEGSDGVYNNDVRGDRRSKLTFLMYLNDVEEGGHTAFPFGVFGDAANRVDDEQESAFAERLSSGDSTTLAPYCASLETSVGGSGGGGARRPHQEGLQHGVGRVE